MASTTAALAEFFVSTSYEDLPSDAVRSAKRMLLDVIGCAIAGTVDQEFVPIATFAASIGASGEVPGPSGQHYDLLSAALIGGAAAHILDYDDLHDYMGGHPTATLFPAVVSLGYINGASGKEVLRAVVLGAEMETRLGMAMNPAHYSVGWHPTGVLGALGAAVASAVILGLNTQQMQTAIGAAASFAGTTKANFGTSLKSIHAGLAARAGVQAALLAKAGATANETILDEQFGGYFELFTPEVHRDKLFDGLGKQYGIVDPGVGFKLLPACASVHSSVWSVIDLYNEQGYDPSAIRAIRAHIDGRRIPHTNRPVINSALEAKFSSQYCQAVAALTGRLSLADFSDDIIFEPTRQELMKKVTLIAEPEAEKWLHPGESDIGSFGALVEIEDVNGNVVSKFNRVPRGCSAAPPTDEVLMEKFIDCASRDDRSTVDIAALAGVIMGLDEVENVQEFVRQIWR